MKVDLQINGQKMAMISALIGSRIFKDYAMTISSISNDLLGSYLFQLEWEIVNSSSVSISCNRDCVVIVALWEHESRQDSLINSLQFDGWLLKNDQPIKGKKDEKYVAAKAVLSQIIQANRSLSFSKHENSLPISVFVFEGNVDYY